jgi:DNA-binding response OmpR family regulator
MMEVRPATERERQIRPGPSGCDAAGMSGLEVAKQLRRRPEQMPALMLTARDALRDIVKGLDAGADDY